MLVTRQTLRRTVNCASSGRPTQQPIAHGMAISPFDPFDVAFPGVIGLETSRSDRGLQPSSLDGGVFDKCVCRAPRIASWATSNLSQTRSAATLSLPRGP